MRNALPERKPWPMKWIIAAIVVFIAGYTYLTLHYRKPGPEYRPYEDMKKRANTLRLLEAGYQRVALPVERPADGVRASDNTAAAPGGLPTALAAVIVDRPLLPTEIIAANAPTAARTGEPFQIYFRCAVPDDKQQLAGAELYVRPGEIIVTPDFELLASGLLTRSRQTLVSLSVPAGTLKPGTYRATLVGQRTSRTWSVTIR